MDWFLQFYSPTPPWTLLPPILHSRKILCLLLLKGDLCSSYAWVHDMQYFSCELFSSSGNSCVWAASYVPPPHHKIARMMHARISLQIALTRHKIPYVNQTSVHSLAEIINRSRERTFVVRFFIVGAETGDAIRVACGSHRVHSFRILMLVWHYYK